MNRILPLAFLSAVLPLAAQQQQAQLDANPAVFSVLAAINAAGFDSEIDSTANSPMRRFARDWIAAKKPESLEDLKRFYAEHKQANPVADFGQYVSFALCLDGPPNFGFRIPPSEMPPDVAPLQGFELILAKFAREADLQGLWKEAQPEFERMIDAYHGPVSNALLQVNGYLRNATSGYLGRRFQVYVDVLGPPNQVQSRSYKDDYFIVITPSRELRTTEIRHGYLHYLLDPLALKFAENLKRVKGVGEYAQAAPALEQSYKDDYTLLATECLIKAVESRLAPSSERGALVDQDLREGYTMTPAFAEGLPAYEKQQIGMRLYFPDLVEAIDLSKEERRLDKVQFAAARTVKTVKADPPPEPPPLTGAEKMIADAQGLSARRDSAPEDLDKARDLFLKSLEKTTNSTLHAKAYYGLARIAALQRNPEMAERLFEKTLELTPDPETKCWSYVYLARLAEASSDRDNVEKNYRAALAVADAPPAAKTAAESGLQRFLKQK